MSIICDNREEVETVINFFESKGYEEFTEMDKSFLAVFIIPAAKTIMTNNVVIARLNEKEGYTSIDFETFKTIAL